MKQLVFFLIVFRCCVSAQTASSACDLNSDGAINVLDVQIAINQSLGLSPCTSGDLNKDAVCNSTDVQIVQTAALGGGCNATSTGSSGNSTANTVTIYETDGVNQSNRPVTIGRAFPQGQIPGCPQPAVGGTPLANYQADVKNRWPDGSVKFAIVSFTVTLAANSSTTVAFQNSTSCNNSGYLTQSQMAGFNSGNWGADIEVTAGGTTRTADAKTMLSALAVQDCQLSYWLQGPVVTQVIVQDCTATSAYDFGWSWNGTSMSSPVTGNAATASLHPIFILSFYPGSNAVKVDYLLENMWTGRMQDQQYSFVLRAGNPLVQVYSHAQWTHIGGTRWRKTFWSGTAAGHVRVDHNFAYLTSTRLLPNYDRSVTVDPNASVGSNSPGYPDFLSGDKGDIGGCGMDCIWGKGYSNNNEGAPIQREDLLYLYNMGVDCGVANGKCAKAWDILTGEVDANPSTTLVGVSGGAGQWNNQGNVPYHMRESRATLSSFYCAAYDDKNATLAAGYPSTCPSGGAGVATGRPLSRHADTAVGYSDAGLPVPAVGTRTLGGWTVTDTSHWLDYSYVAYLLTGDYYFYDEELQGGSFALDSTNPNQASGSSNYFFGYIAPVPGGARKWGWGMQVLARSASLAVDGTVESKYYRAMLNSNLEIQEGVMGITGTALTPTTADSTGFATDTACSSYSFNNPVNRWNWGRCTVYSQCDNVLCTSTMNNAVANTQHSLIAGECVAALGSHQGTISSATNGSPTVFTTSASNSLANGEPISIWGASGAWTAVNTAWWDTTTGLGSNQFSVPFSSAGLGGLTGSVQYSDGQLDVTATTDFVQDWMSWGALTALGHVQELGFAQAAPVATESYKRLLEELQDPGYNPYMTAVYVSPYKNGSSQVCVGMTTRNQGYATWAQANAGLVPFLQSAKSFHSNLGGLTGNFSCADHGYSLMVRAAATYITGVTETCPSGGTCSGQAAWNFVGVSGYTGGNGGAVPYFNNQAYVDDAGCNATILGSQIKFALLPR